MQKKGQDKQSYPAQRRAVSERDRGGLLYNLIYITNNIIFLFPQQENKKNC